MQYKNIQYIKNKIFEKSSFQQKKLEDFFSKQDEKFNQDFELFLEEYIEYLNKNDMTIDYGIDAYLKKLLNYLHVFYSFQLFYLLSVLLFSFLSLF